MRETNTKKVAVVRSTYHAVVKQYMDIIQAAFEKAGFDTVEVSPTQKIDKKSIVVTDSPVVAIKYLLRGYKSHCVWYQGVLPEESFMLNHKRIKFKLLSMLEKKVMKKAKLLFFVSEHMKRFYESKYKLNLETKSFVMPCFNEKSITQNAFDGKSSEVSFVYLGGLQKWQCFDQTAKIYSEIEKRLKQKTKFYVFTKAREQAEIVLKEYGIKNYEIDFVSSEELSERIKSIKYGFVLREESIVNNVATPTKFSNYISNGIVPIYSDSIKSFAECDLEINLGIVCNLNDFAAGVDNICSRIEEPYDLLEIKKKCEMFFEKYYNLDFYVQQISELVSEIDF